MASSSACEKAEYQHFVPQFLLRKFARKFRPHEKGPKQAQRARRGRADKIYSGELVVNHINLTNDVLGVETAKVKRVLGMNSMYQDMSQATAKQRYRIEEIFGKWEAKLAPIFLKIIKSCEGGDPGLWLSRTERNDIRNFFFLLKYRGSQFHQRFSSETPHDYDKDDKSLLQEYMREKGIQRPVNVWFQGIEAISECDMDPRGEWREKICEVMYPLDAKWFINHTECSYMAFCTPSDPDGEFILMEGSYNIFEGVSYPLGPWINFHDLAPISPKLMIVLRSFILPIEEEDTDSEIRELRKSWYDAAVNLVFGPGIESKLADLPITKARNNYMHIVDGRLRSLNENSPRTKNDKFLFNFFKVDELHINKINAFFLENAQSSIVFASQQAFTKTLEFYMTDRSRIWKSIVGTATEKSLKVARLVRLAALMEFLGSDALPFWEDYSVTLKEDRKITYTGLGPTTTLRSELQKVFRTDAKIAQLDEEASQQTPPPLHGPFMKLYILLGGTLDKSMYNVEQSRRMLNLQIKLDVWSKDLGVPEHMREFGREKLLDAYMQLPPVRIWLYSKQLRCMFRSHRQKVLGDYGFSSLGLDILGNCDKPEHIIAPAISQLATGEALNRIIYNTAMNSIEMDNTGAFQPWAPITPVDIRKMPFMHKFIFGYGSISQCKISVIKDLVKAQLALIRLHGLPRQAVLYQEFLEAHEVIEVWVRIGLQKELEKVAKHTPNLWSSSVHKIWFDVTYPTPPISTS